MKIHMAARFRHYRRHVEAVWKHLPLELQGQVLMGQRVSGRQLPVGDIVMVGGWWDISAFPKQKIIYVEHGAGQSYRGDESAAGHPAYHGGEHPERVIGYISPNQRVADSWGRPAFAAGCPALDVHANRISRHRRTVAITFHWDARRVCPEAWSAREHWLDDLHSLVNLMRTDFEVIGTWHPRDAHGRQIWKFLNVEAVGDTDEVLERAGVLVADNTSLQYEAAALGIPNVVLNAPWYRRDVEHGLRFWDHVPGQMVDDIEQFAAIDMLKYARDENAKRVARSAAEYAYARPPGGNGEAAARWIEKLIDGQV